MKTKPLLAALAVAAASVGGYWYYSPYMAFKDIRQAAQRNDSDAFNAQVDYPRVRDSLKGQISARMSQELGANQDNGFATLGTMLGMVVVNQMVEAFVRPEMVMRALQQGQMKSGPNDDRVGQAEPADNRKVEWALERKGLDKVIAYSQRPDQAEVDRDVGLVFERYGFSDWKLTEIRLGKL